MDKNFFLNLTKLHKNFVFIGEAGSGKTELSTNLAILLASACEKPVHFFDMDQTKPLFRARNIADEMKSAGVLVHYHEQQMDAPTVVGGVIENLLDKDAIVLLDIGGGSYGSHMIGQFSHILNRDETRILYIVNPFRPWSAEDFNIRETMARTLGAARLHEMELVANPNLGVTSCMDDIHEGMRRMNELFPNENIVFAAALEHLADEFEKQYKLNVLPMTIRTRPDWM